MNIERLLTEVEQFVVCASESRLGIGPLVLLASIALVLWSTTAIVRWLVYVAAQLARAVFTAVTSLSTLVAACLVLAVFALTR